MNHRRLVVQTVVLLAILGIFVHWARPYYNWDMLPYIGVAYRLGGASVEEAHMRTYAVSEAAAPAREHRWNTQGGAYRRTVTRDPAAFGQQLPFYSVKPAYPALMLALMRTGLNGVDASVWISRAAYLGIGVILLLWLASFLAPIPAVATTAGVMGLPFVLDLARLSTPDALSTLLVLPALWLVFDQRRLRAGTALLVLSVPVRPDNLLWVVVVAAYGALRRREDRKAAVAFVGVATLAYLIQAQASGNLGWVTLFHHSFVERLAHPATLEPSLSLPGYLWIYLRETHPVSLPRFILLFALLGVWLFVARVRRHGRSDDGAALVAAFGVFAALHWLVYPGEDRFLVAGYLATLVVLVRTLAETTRPLSRPHTAPAPRHPAVHPGAPGAS